MTAAAFEDEAAWGYSRSTLGQLKRDYPMVGTEDVFYITRGGGAVDGSGGGTFPRKPLF